MLTTVNVLSYNMQKDESQAKTIKQLNRLVKTQSKTIEDQKRVIDFQLEVIGKLHQQLKNEN